MILFFFLKSLKVFSVALKFHYNISRCYISIIILLSFKWSLKSEKPSLFKLKDFTLWLLEDLQGGTSGNEPASGGDIRYLGSIPGLGRSPGEGMASYSSILAWRIPWTKEPGVLQSIRSQRVGDDWSNLTHAHTDFWTRGSSSWYGEEVWMSGPWWRKNHPELTQREGAHGSVHGPDSASAWITFELPVVHGLYFNIRDLVLIFILNLV